MQHSIRKPSAELNLFQNTNYTTSKPSAQGSNPAPGRRKQIKFLFDELLKNRQNKYFLPIILMQFLLFQKGSFICAAFIHILLFLYKKAYLTEGSHTSISKGTMNFVFQLYPFVSLKEHVTELHVTCLFQHPDIKINKGEGAWSSQFLNDQC